MSIFELKGRGGPGTGTGREGDVQRAGRSVTKRAEPAFNTGSLRAMRYHGLLKERTESKLRFYCDFSAGVCVWMFVKQEMIEDDHDIVYQSLIHSFIQPSIHLSVYLIIYLFIHQFMHLYTFVFPVISPCITRLLLQPSQPSHSHSSPPSPPRFQVQDYHHFFPTPARAQ